MMRFPTLAAVGLLLFAFAFTTPSATFAQPDDPAATADDPFGDESATPAEDATDPAMSDDFSFDDSDFNFDEMEEWDEAAWEEEFGNQPFDPNAPPDELVGLLIGVYGVAILIGLIIGFGILALICWLVSSALKAVPEQYREMSTGQIWLLMIPCFPLIWNFFVYQRVPRSFQNYFNAVGQTQHGDCGAQIGLWYAICSACSIVPCLNYIAGPASLVLLIIMLVKLWGLKGEAEKLQSGGGDMSTSTLDV